MKDYDVKAVTTTRIDGKIKIVWIPDFPQICGDDLYKVNFNVSTTCYFMS